MKAYFFTYNKDSRGIGAKIKLLCDNEQVATNNMNNILTLIESQVKIGEMNEYKFSSEVKDIFAAGDLNLCSLLKNGQIIDGQTLNVARTKVQSVEESLEFRQTNYCDMQGNKIHASSNGIGSWEGNINDIVYEKNDEYVFGKNYRLIRTEKGIQFAIFDESKKETKLLKICLQEITNPKTEYEHKHSGRTADCFDGREFIEWSTNKYVVSGKDGIYFDYHGTIYKLLLTYESYLSNVCHIVVSNDIQDIEKIKKIIADKIVLNNDGTITFYDGWNVSHLQHRLSVPNSFSELCNLAVKWKNVVDCKVVRIEGKQHLYGLTKNGKILNTYSDSITNELNYISPIYLWEGGLIAVGK